MLDQEILESGDEGKFYHLQRRIRFVNYRSLYSGRALRLDMKTLADAFVLR